MMLNNKRYDKLTLSVSQFQSDELIEIGFTQFRVITTEVLAIEELPGISTTIEPGTVALLVISECDPSAPGVHGMVFHIDPNDRASCLTAIGVLEDTLLSLGETHPHITCSFDLVRAIETIRQRFPHFDVVNFTQFNVVEFTPDLTLYTPMMDADEPYVLTDEDYLESITDGCLPTGHPIVRGLVFPAAVFMGELEDKPAKKRKSYSDVLAEAKQAQAARRRSKSKGKSGKVKSKTKK